MKFKKEYAYGIVGVIAVITAFQLTKAITSSIITLAIVGAGGFFAYKKYNSKT